MKKLLYLLFLFITAAAFAQAPSTINYQAVLRDANNNAFNNNGNPIELTFRVYAGTSGTPSWSKTYNDVPVSDFGVINTYFGGLDGSTDLSDLDWANTAYELQVIANSTTDLGRKPLATVPYALNARSYTEGTGIDIASGVITNTAPDQTVSLTGVGLTVSGTYPNFTITAVDLTPAGTIVAFGGTTAPAGWLLCDGGSYSTTNEAALYGAIGYRYGGSGGSFNVPDFRGVFLRGAQMNRTAGGDPDVNSRTANGSIPKNEPGSSQSGATMLPTNNFTGGTSTNGSHTHVITLWQDNWFAGGGSQGAIDDDSNSNNPDNYTSTANGDHTHSVTIDGGGDAETRPVNVYVNYIIKK